MADLTVAVRAHRQLAEQIRSAFPEADEETVAGSVEAATELDQAIVAVVRAAIEREAMAEALGGLIKQMSERKKRLEDGAAAMRRACLQAMLDVGWSRLPVKPPDFTLSVAQGKPRVIITDEAALPEFVVTTVRKPDKAEISALLSSGNSIPGAVLGNPEPHLTISRR